MWKLHSARHTACEAGTGGSHSLALFSPSPAAIHRRLSSFMGRVFVSALRVYPQWLKNILGCFLFPHLIRKLKEREAKRVMPCQDTNQGGQWCPEIPSRATCPFMVHGGIPAPPSSPSDGALEIPPKKTLWWIKWHCSESGQRITSLFCSWIYFRVTLTFIRTFT